MYRNIKRLLQSVSIVLIGAFTTGCNFFQAGPDYDRSTADQPTVQPDAQRSIVNWADASSGLRSMPSKGDVNLLVVPVEIKDFAESDYLNFNSQSGNVLKMMGGFSEEESWSLNNNDFNVDWPQLIEDSFFGETEDTGFESISSFYEKSSYGQLRIHGVVSPVFKTEKTYDELIDQMNSEGSKAVTDEIVSDVYQTFFKREKIYDLEDFDSDGDRVVDGIWLVYDIPDSSMDPTMQLSSDLWWAYTTWNTDRTASSQGFNVYCWASKWFLINGLYANFPYMDIFSNVKADAHTFIHETGHMLGLNDYYDTAGLYRTRNPAGGLIMMDHNVYDQDVYSKYLLGWVTPRQYWADDLNTAQTITLRPFVETGDCIVLNLPDNSGWVGEEYVILAYWTPTGLNLTDSENPYMSQLGIDEYYGFNQPGIMAFQVDSRYLRYAPQGGVWTAIDEASEDEIINAEDDSYSEAFMLLTNNDTGNYEGLNYSVSDVQLMLIDAQNQYAHMQLQTSRNFVTADNSYLFHDGDTYDSSYLGLKGDALIAFHGDSYLAGEGLDTSLSTGIRVEFGPQNDAGAQLTLSAE